MTMDDRQREALELCVALAIERGGVCLSREYRDGKSKLRWRCAARHEWEAIPTSVRRGSWCARCSNAERGRRKSEVFFAHVIALAHARGGECLSTEYTHSQTHLRWRCAEDHEWTAVPASIANGTWCPDCSGAKPLTIEDLRAMAAEHGGECLSTAYVDQGTPVRWRCAAGHEWESKVQQVRYKGRWCNRCAFVPSKTPDDFRALAARFGGEWLASGIGGTHDPYDWRCSMGHVFSLSYHQVQQDHWCSRCRSPGQSDIRRMRRIARKRGGECLSPEYLGWDAKLRWRCREGHEWEALPGTIVQGHWCWTCGRRGHSTERLTIEDMHATAGERRGRCVSTRYDGVDRHLLWECALGHRWRAAPSRVRGGSWCPTCAHAFPGTIEGMRLIAASHRGRCLSAEYAGHRTVLRWECEAGHRFELTGTAAKSGAWCRACPSARPG
jgi:hypothetical protein